MNDGLKHAVELAQGVRYSGDGKRDRADLGQRPGAEQFRFEMATNGLRIGASVTPVIARCLDNVLERLAVPRESIDAYVYHSPDLQAMCCMVNVRAAVLSFSSGLVNLLSPEELEFVAGHEIGHFLLGHEARSTNAGSLEDFRQSPAQEISADRVGILGCQSVEAGVRALIKTGCGLGDHHLRFDIGSYLNQLRKLKAPDLRGAQMPTHPSMAVRCRALLWFSMHSSSFQEGINPSNLQALKKVDGFIAKDLETFCEQPMQQKIQSHRDDYLLWYAAYLALEDGRLEKYGQVALKTLLRDLDERTGEVEEYTYGKLINLLPGMSVAEVVSFVTERLDEARKVLVERLGDDYSAELRGIEHRVNDCFEACRKDRPT